METEQYTYRGFTESEIRVAMKRIEPVSWADVPVQTWAGTVWMRPTKLASTKHDGGCGHCLFIDLCQDAVTAGGYCGCESVLIGEVMG